MDRLAPRIFLLACALAAWCAAGSAHAQDCPPLDLYYPADDSQWSTVLPALDALLPLCLTSAEYFALRGAAQLNTGRVPTALESLERALLLDPANGAAHIDYAEALFIAGQLFPALEINAALLERDDLPPQLIPAITERQQLWRTYTRSRGLFGELSVGHDSNLNGAPSRSEFTLTLSGELIPLTLDPEFQRTGGPYLNTRVVGYFQQLHPDRTHDWVFSLRSRNSEHEESDLLQFDWRHALALPMRRYQWDLTAGTSHLLYGGSPLYTVLEGRARLHEIGAGCRPQAELALQQQLYHGQDIMSGLEGSLTGGMECRANGGRRVVGVDAGVIGNSARRSARPGDDRGGWTTRLFWLEQVAGGTLNVQLSYARLEDDSGYSPLLNDDARRQVDNRFLRVQYTRPLLPDLDLLFNLSHQNQGSNLAPFQNRGTAVDIGVRLDF